MNKWKQNIEDGNYTPHEQPSLCQLTTKGPHMGLLVPLELQDLGSHMGSGPAWTLLLVVGFYTGHLLSLNFRVCPRVFSELTV